MGIGKIIIGVLTVVLAGLCLVVSTQEETAEATMELTLEFAVQTGGYTENIQAWEDPEGDFYVFLPGYADLDQTRICLRGGDISADIDGVPMTHWVAMGIFSLEHPLNMTISAGETVTHTTVRFVQAGSLPTLCVDVASGSMEYLHLDKNNKESGSLRLYDAEGALLCEETLTQMSGRGNTSWDSEKKPYNLTLAQNRDLLGMGSAQNWVLLAEEYNDINLRNKIVYDFAKQTGLSFTPDCEWVDLYLNGEYAGLYLLCEKNEVHPQRMDISPEGSFVVSMEYESRLQKQKYPYVLTEADQALRIRHGADRTEQLQTHWQSVENAILSEDGVDPASGKTWQELIDLDSWVRKYLIEEVFGNLDAGSLSQYYYIDGTDPEGKVFAGPVWDYDFAMDDASVWLTGYTDYFVMNRSAVNEDVQTPWFPALYHREEFYSRIQDLYAAEFLPLLETTVTESIPAYVEIIRDSARMDRIRWCLESDRVEDAAAHIQSFLRDRMDFLTDLWLHGTVYHTVCVDPGRDNLYGWLAVKHGDVLPELPSFEEIGGLGWYNAVTDEPFDITQPICEDVCLCIKKPDVGLPVIHYLPGAALLLALPLLILLDRFRAGRRGKEK